MDWATIGVIRVFILIGELLIGFVYYSLKIIFWLLNKLRLTGLAIWFIGMVVVYGTNMEWCQKLQQNKVFPILYWILGGTILVISVLWIIGDIIRLFNPYFSFLNIPDYISKDREKIAALTKDTTWFHGLDSKKLIKKKYKTLKNGYKYAPNALEPEMMIEIDKEYKYITEFLK